MSLSRMIPIATLMLLATSVPSRATSVAAGACAPDALKFKVSETAFNTSSTTFVDVPDSNIKFIQGGTKPSCAVVSFSSEAGADANTVVAIEAVLDNSTICRPRLNTFLNTGAAEGVADRAMNYVCPDVAPGAHSIKMHITITTGGNVTLDFRTMIVQHAK